MRRSLLAALLCFVVVPLGGAQQNAKDAPASKEDVERFLDAMHTRQMMKSMMAAMAAQMHEMVHEQVLKVPNLPSDFEAKQNTRMDEFLRNFPIDEMVQAMIPVYQRHFTKGEMDDLVAFYSSPTGQKMVHELPAITAEAMQSSQAIIQRMIAQEMRHIQEEIATIQKQSRVPSAKPE
jgi:uncharacterized protein